MALTPSWPGPTGVATTTDGRKAIAGLIAKNAAGVARVGVFPRHTNDLVTARVDMNLDLGIFEAAASQFGGPILLTNDAVAQLPSVLVSPGAGTNFYIIYAKQNESTAPGTDANNNRVFGAQLSTTSFAVARAALPAGALELATVQMPTGKTATNQVGVSITQTFQYTAPEGGPILLRNATEEAAWTPHDGSLSYRLDLGMFRDRVGGVWVTRGGGVSVRTAAPQSSGAAFTPVAVTWELEDFDTDSYHSTSSNTSRLVAPVAGIYQVTARLRYASTAFAGGVQLGKNGVWTDLTSRVVQPPWAGGGTGSFPQTSRRFQLAAGDYIEVGTTTEAAGLSLTVAECYAEMVRVS